MKPLSKLALSGLLLLTAHSMSFAATYTLHITGSTAFRAASVNAVVNYLYNNSTTPHVAPVAAYDGSSLTGANESIVKGTLANGDVVIAEFAWTGSVQGIHDTANAVNPPVVGGGTSPWMDPTNALSSVTVAAAPGVSSGGTSNSSPVWAAAAAPDLSLSDVWQASTLFPGGGVNGVANSLTEVVPNGIGLQAFVMVANNQGASFNNGSFVANGVACTITAGSNVVNFGSNTQYLAPGFTLSSTYASNHSAYIPPFAVITSVNVPAQTVTLSVAAGGTTGTVLSVNTAVALAGISNVTKEAMYDLFANGKGSIPLSELTGYPADSTRPVVAIGRNPDSGTRVCFTEVIGLKNETALNQVYQCEPTNSSGARITNSTDTIAGIGGEPSATFNGLTLAKGNNGYTSGGQLSSFMQNPNTTTVLSGWFFVSPLGISDATAAVNGGAIPLTFEGVPFNAVSVENGQYPLWAYEHFYKSAALAGQALTYAQAIGNQLVTSDAQLGGDLLSNMQATRSPITTDGAPILNNNSISL